MNVFCDTSVLVAGSLEDHVDFARADHVLSRIERGDDIGFASAHTLAEAFAVLSRMPTTPKLLPQDVLAMLQNDLIPHFTFMALQPHDYIEAIGALAAKGLGGGRIYDLLHLRVAAKLTLDRIYTFNEREWKTLAPELASLIAAPAAIETRPSGS